MRRDWSAGVRATDLAAAAAGALVGAWLGFHAAEAPLAFPAAVVGSVAGGNVLLLALDLAWDRQGRERFAAGRLEPRPSAG